MNPDMNDERGGKDSWFEHVSAIEWTFATYGDMEQPEYQVNQVSDERYLFLGRGNFVFMMNKREGCVQSRRRDEAREFEGDGQQCWGWSCT
jgi:hypothetical protein